MTKVISKRLAIKALFMGCLAKMAHADQISTASSSGILLSSGLSVPTSWTINLDQMSNLTVYWKGEKITIPADEIFAALRS